MTANEIRQQLKNEALNNIRAVFYKKYEWYGCCDDLTVGELRAYDIKDILEQLDRELKKVKGEQQTGRWNHG